MSIKPQISEQGFSLLEVAVVLLITGALLGTMLKPFGAQMIEQQRLETRLQLSHIREAVLGYAIANSRLPCPLTDSTQPQGNCSVAHGNVPAAELGIDGSYDQNGFLVDAWGAPIRYSVTQSDADGDALADFTLVHGMQTVGIQSLSPDFEVCDSAPTCAALRANQLPVVILSTGASSAPRSADERENTDGDNRFIKRDLDQSGTDQFDDLLVWVSENALYTRMIQARVLP